MRRFVALGIMVATLLTGLTTRADGAVAGSPYFTSGSQVNSYLTRGHFRGYALLVRHGTVLLSQGYGMADSRHHIPNTIQSRWPMFGVEGFMMAMVVLKLQEQRRLSVGGKLCQYLKSCPASWAPITLQHLLLGTSGIASGPKSPTSSRGTTIAQTVYQCQATPLSGTPGTLLDDNTCNRVLLSVVIAKVAGQPFGKVLRQVIFRPAGMTESSVVTSTPKVSALGYQFGSLAPPVHSRYPQVYSTVADVLRLDRALLAGKIISKTSRDSLLAPHINDNPGGNVPVYRGYGQTYVIKAHQFPGIADNSLSPLNTEKVVFQTSGPEGSGFTTDNWLSPHDGTIAIWMNNDNTVFNGNADNTFIGRCAKLLWSR